MRLKRFGALAAALALALSLTTAPAHAATFSDVEEHWAKEYIVRMANQGYAKGYDDGTFKPDGKMTAAETLLFCARATGVAASTQDRIAEARREEMEEILPEGMAAWAAKEMAVAVETGVLSISELDALSQAGALAKTITRENICMYLVRAMQLEPLAKSLTTYTLTYEDKDKISSSLRPYVYVLTNFGVVQGTDLGEFDPQGSVTRGQMTTMLCRALDFMKTAGITAELSEYTTYDWAAGTVAATTSSADGGVILTLNNDISGTRSYSVPATAKIYEDNMLTSASALKNGQYVRLNLSASGAVREVRMLGGLTTYAGSITSLHGNQLSILVSGTNRNMTIDRFTEVMAGNTVGDRSIIDMESGYTSATCYVDEMGHLAGVIFNGGTQMVEGLVESVTTSGSTTTLGVSSFNGVVYRYNVPTGIAVTVNGVLGSLSAAQVGKHVQVRIDNETGVAASVAVDTVNTYVQGPIKKIGTIGTARNIYIANQFTGRDVSYTVSQSAVITYNGQAKTISQIENGWYVTVLVTNGSISQMEAFPGSVTVEGVVSNLRYGTNAITMEVTRKDESIVTYSLDITDLPTINRNKQASSIDQLRTGDSVVLTIRYNQVEKVEATPQESNVSGTISKVTLETHGVTMDVTLLGGGTATYTVSEGVSVTQSGKATNIYALKPGYTVELVTNGDEVVSVVVTSSASSATQVVGTVLLTTNASGVRSMTVLVTDSMGKSTPVVVDVKNAQLMSITGESLNINTGFAAGDTVQAFGNYDGANFVATIVIKQ